MIPIEAIEGAALEVMRRAAIDIPEDYRKGVEECRKAETGELARFVIEAMQDNWNAASEDRRPMCADTGVPRYYVKHGNEAVVQSGFVGVEHVLRRATASATMSIPLRPNRVHPLWRTDHNNNVGINAPEIEWSFEPYADWIEVTTVHKGGLFGTDYRMLFPGDGINGIKRFVIDTLVSFGKRGLASQPAIIGIGPWGLWGRWALSARRWLSIVTLRLVTRTQAGCRSACMPSAFRRAERPHTCTVMEALSTERILVGSHPI